MSTGDLKTRVGLWARPHIIFMTIAYTFSWLFWIGSWAITRSMNAGDQLINADLVWALFFDGGGTTTIVWLSLLSLVGVWGPMIGGIVATRLDPGTSSGDLRVRVRRVAVGGREYGLVLAILLLIVGPVALIVALTTDMVPNAPSAGTFLVFLFVFFVVQMLTSGTEEIGWRGLPQREAPPREELLGHRLGSWASMGRMALPDRGHHLHPTRYGTRCDPRIARRILDRNRGCSDPPRLVLRAKRERVPQHLHPCDLQHDAVGDGFSVQRLAGSGHRQSGPLGSCDLPEAALRAAAPCPTSSPYELEVGDWSEVGSPTR